MSVKLSDRDADMERLHADGWSCAKLALRFSLSRERVRQILTARGVDTRAKLRHRRGVCVECGGTFRYYSSVKPATCGGGCTNAYKSRRRGIGPEMRRRAIEMLDAGHPAEEVVRALGVSRSWVGGLSIPSYRKRFLGERLTDPKHREALMLCVDLLRGQSMTWREVGTILRRKSEQLAFTYNAWKRPCR